MPKGHAIKSKRQWRALWAKAGRGEIPVSTVRKMTRESRRYRSLSGISIASRCPREGTRVKFNPSPASMALYSFPPRPGTYGTVTTIPGMSKRGTCIKGPGGGLVFVMWGKNKTTMGVSSYDLDRVR